MTMTKSDVSLLGILQFFYVSLKNFCVTDYKPKIQTFIYYIIEMKLVTFIILSVCTSFIVKYIIALTFSYTKVKD